ncbi:MAG: pre-mRNA-splicing factor cwc22 [Bathelium mastoideum]|nr:MAG: pre-mRNA-splicing factor cwc22 [Bathelium mastoideum]
MEVLSAVRLPTPEPVDPSERRKRSPPSRSPSPRRRPSPPRRRSHSRSPDRDGVPVARKDTVRRRPEPQKADEGGVPLPRDVDRRRAVERQRQLDLRMKEETAAAAKPLTEEDKQAAAKAEYEKLLNMRSGGTYIPPARLRALQAQITDKTSKEYQRMAWEALKKSINGLINKVNVANIKHIVPELFGENLVRGRGLFCRSIMKAQAASLPFTAIYAATVAIVNTKLPQVGELLVKRLVVQFRKAFKRNDKAVCLSSTTFIAHLVNQQVVNEMLVAQILLLLLNKPTDDSVEIAVGLTREVGQHLEEFASQIGMVIYDQFRSILHEADIDKRTQYMVEVLFQVRKDRYKDNPAVKDELDLVEEEDQITHQISLDEEVDVQDGLNIFKFDAEWENNEEAYKKLRAEILGEAEGSGDEEDETDDSSDDDEAKEERAIVIKDESNTQLVNLRRTIYLTIKSSGQFEECCHKLMKINLPMGQEYELVSMIVECASQERTYDKFYGLIGERFCKLNRLWNDLFEEGFVKYYDSIHRYETNRLRIIAQFFGHLLASGAIGWHVLSTVHLNEEETTSSSRIFIKILFEDLSQALGMRSLADKLKDPLLQPSMAGIFPTDDPRNTRFAINFFTAVGMGVLTEGMREFLKNIPKPEIPALPEKEASDHDSVSSYSSYSSYSSRSRSRSTSRIPPQRGVRARGRSYSRSSSSSRSPSRTPPRRSDRRGARSISSSRSRTPPRRTKPTPSRPRGRPRSHSVSSSISTSRSPTPPPRHRRRPASSSSRSRSSSTPPPTRRHRSPSSPPRSPPPPRRAAANGRGARRLSPSLSRSRSPARSPPPSRRRADPPRRRRNSSSPPSRSPAPPRRRPVADGRRRPSPSPKPRARGTHGRARQMSASPPPPQQEERGTAGTRRRRGSSAAGSDGERARKPERKAEEKKKVEAGAKGEDYVHPSRRGMVPGAGSGTGPGSGAAVGRRKKASDFL